MSRSADPAPRTEPAASEPRPAPPTESSGRWGRTKDFLTDVVNRAGDDRVFFLASGLTFSLVLAAIPFLVLVLSLPAVLFGPEVERFQEQAIDWILANILPVVTVEVEAEVRRQVQTIIDAAGQIGLVSAILFAWFATRLFGALRTALSEVFDLEDTRSPIGGKLTDFRLVVVSTILLVVNISLTTFITIQGREALRVLGLAREWLQDLVTVATVFGTIYVMFLLIYKFVPARRLYWRTAAVAALFAAVMFELLKLAFSWYVVNWADYANVFFAFATIVVLVIGAYYASVLFLIGGEVAKVYERRRLARRQREILD